MLTPAQRETYRSQCDELVDYALSQGCAQVRAEFNHIEHFTIDTHNHEVETLQQSTGVGLTLRLFVDGRYGSYSTNRMELGELRAFIDRAIHNTRLLEPDEARTLPDPARYYHPAPEGEADLESCDEDIVTTPADEKKALALETANSTGQRDSRIISLDSSLMDRIGWQYLVDSQGFRGESRASICNLTSSVSLKGEGESRPSGYESLLSVSYADLRRRMDRRAESLADSAHRRAYCKVGQRPIEPGFYNLIVEARVVGKLLDPLLDVLYGANIFQQRSFLAGKVGERVASPLLTLRDEPLRRGAIGSCYFDYEGVATEPFDIFRDGVLCTDFIDTYYAHKLQRTPTNSGPCVLAMTPGERSQCKLMAFSERAIDITGFNGGNYNEVTGDFSFGIEGILIENGEMTTPVAGMNLTGNLLDLWQHLIEVGNETEQTALGFVPTLVFEGGKIG
jgi:PmbA protein